eukprot:9143330-Alexandrium_andersonii.AAC.1
MTQSRACRLQAVRRSTGCARPPEEALRARQERAPRRWPRGGQRLRARACVCAPCVRMRVCACV